MFKGTPPPPTICAWCDSPVNTLQLCCWSFLHKKLYSIIADFIPVKCSFISKNIHFAFLAPFVHLRFIGKLIVDFIFLLTDFAVLQLKHYERILIRNQFLMQVGQLRPNFHAEGGVPTNKFCTDR